MKDFRHSDRLWLAENFKNKLKKKPMRIIELQESEEEFWIEKPENEYILNINAAKIQNEDRKFCVELAGWAAYSSFGVMMG